MKLLEHGSVYVVRAKGGVSEVFINRGSEFEWDDGML